MYFMLKGTVNVPFLMASSLLHLSVCHLIFFQLVFLSRIITCIIHANFTDLFSLHL